MGMVCDMAYLKNAFVFSVWGILIIFVMSLYTMSYFLSD